MKLSKFLKEQETNLTCGCGHVDSCPECALRQIINHRELSAKQQKELKDLCFNWNATAKDFWNVVKE